MGNDTHWLWRFPQKGRATGYYRWEELRLWYSTQEASLTPLRRRVLPAERACGRRWRAGVAARRWDVRRCREEHTALGPLVTVSPVPSSPEVKAGHALRGRSLGGFKAAISPQ